MGLNKPSETSYQKARNLVFTFFGIKNKKPTDVEVDAAIAKGIK